jgi:hypothetical protein
MNLPYHKEQHFRISSDLNFNAIPTHATPIMDLFNYPIVNGVKMNHIPATP